MKKNKWAAIDKSLRASNIINEGVELNLYSEDEQIFAVRKNPTDIIFIKNPSEAVQFAAVMKDVGALLAIKNPTDNVVLYAIKKDPYSIDYVKHPSKNMVLTSVLAQIKHYRGNYFEPKVYIKYKELHPEWDEWKVIDKSLDQLGLIPTAK